MQPETPYQTNLSGTKNPAGDYDLLRQLGLEHARKLGGSIWTDFNIHDPGVTILELLCYALTDLGYRTSFPMGDLLTPKEGKGPTLKNTFYTANEILTSHPVTIEDYRKLLIDRVPGIRNAWLEPLTHYTYTFTDEQNKTQTVTPNGLYKVKVVLDDYETINRRHPVMLQMLTAYRSNRILVSDRFRSDAFILPEKMINPLTRKTKVSKVEYRNCYKNYLRQFLLKFRNLCEDVEEIEILDEVTLTICAKLELKPGAADSDVITEVYRKVYEYVHPEVKRYSLQQMLNKGKRVEEIFRGASAGRGFIDDEELRQLQHRTSLYTSDIINLLMDIDGIVAVPTLSLNIFKGDIPLVKESRYVVSLPDPSRQTFRFYFEDMDKDPQERRNHIAISKGQFCYNAGKVKGKSILTEEAVEGLAEDLPAPVGRNRKLDAYYSIQDEFPKCYKTGREGISPSETDLRKGQRRQLKAYLLLFEQLMADYLVQLNAVKYLLSWGRQPDDSKPGYPVTDPEHAGTYLYKILSEKEIPGFVELFDGSNYKDYEKVLESLQTEKDRRNRLLDHLLARFNERFVEYTLVKFNNSGAPEPFEEYTATEKVANRIDFLKHYPRISCQRYHAVNYAYPHDSQNFTTLELRVAKALGIDASNMSLYLSRPLLDPVTGNIIMKEGKCLFADTRFQPFEKTFGLHIYEHILLRPPKATPGQKCTRFRLRTTPGTSVTHYPDPYSMMTTVVLPGWLSIAGRIEFRRFVERVIRSEMPAHVTVKICWVDPLQMYQLEKAWSAFTCNLRPLLSAIPTTTEKTALAAFITKQNALTEALMAIYNIYPPSGLDETYLTQPGMEPTSPFVLGFSRLFDENPLYAFEPTE